MRQIVKKIVFHPLVLKLLNVLLNGIPWDPKRADVTLGRNTLLKQCKIKVVGENNVLMVGNGVRMNKCNIQFGGSGNKVIIEDDCSLVGLNVYIENDGNVIHIGKRVAVTGNTILSVIEGTKITIGDDCLFSRDIYLSTGDGHSVCDMEGKRKNPSKDISIGKHVWLGYRVVMNKGVTIGNDCIIGASSVCTSRLPIEDNIAIAGNPAIKVKEKVTWDIDRI